MAKIQGMKEKLHHPIYDAFVLGSSVPQGTNPPTALEAAMTDPRVIRFFVDVQHKTRLETNLQAAGMLPSLNSFEARAMRVVMSPPTAYGGDTGNGIRNLIYNTVMSLVVGEKVMIEMPTFWFPSGAGVDNGGPGHGAPDPTATFRFAEPVFIEPQQSFRVEMAFPRGAGVVGKFHTFNIWVVLDGYLTRDVQ